MDFVAMETHLGGRSSQQDDSLILYNFMSINDTPIHLFAIFDGHGSDGHKASYAAKVQFPLILRDLQDQVIKNPLAALKIAFDSVNKYMSEDDSWDSYLSGTTAVVALYQPASSQIHVAHVGDSKLVIISELESPAITSETDSGNSINQNRKKSEIASESVMQSVLSKTKNMNTKIILSGKSITWDHNCETPVEVNRVLKAGGRVEQLMIDGKYEGPKRIFKGTLPYPGITVTRSLGDVAAQRLGVIAEPDVQTFDIDDSVRYIVMATDGLWDGISIQEAANCLSGVSSAAEGAKLLIKAGLDGLSRQHIDDNDLGPKRDDALLMNDKFQNGIQFLNFYFCIQVFLIVSLLGEMKTLFTQMIRKTQQDALLKMLNLNNDINSGDTTSTSNIAWKVLIYDKFGQDVISPSLRLGDLRAAGITLHMSLFGSRQPIPDVPAIYFVQPTSQNIKIIAQDLRNGLYESVYINFSSSLPRTLLEELASATVASNTSTCISQVYDQFLNYICLESNLFSLEMPGAYQLIHNPTSPESLITELIDGIAGALFSVIVTLGSVPIIKCPKGNVAEAIAKKLDTKLRDNILNSRTNLFADSMLQSRPVLILLDRDLDLCSMLTHSWTYSALFQDLLEMKLNRVSLKTEERGQPTVKSYDIDVNDDFWQKNSSCPLPEVGIFIEKETKSYKEEVKDDDDSTADANLSTQALSSKIKALPELRRRRKVLDMHTAIATSLLNNIVKRQLDAFISMEESVEKLNTVALIEVIKDPKKESQDKLRLVLIFLLTFGAHLPKSEVTEIENALIAIECSTSALHYIKQVLMVSKMTAASQQQKPAEPSMQTNDLLNSFTTNFSKITEGLQAVGIGEGFGSLINGVRNLLPGRHDLPVTRLVEAIMDGGSYAGVDDYLVFDPKTPKSSSVQHSKKSTFSDAIVFVVGGGNYQEYHNLRDYSLRSTAVKKSVIYGSTELVSSASFIMELEALGGSQK